MTISPEPETTTPETPAAEATPPATRLGQVSARGRRVWSRTVELVRGNRWFSLALLAGALLRLCAMIGFQPIMWFNDGLEYLGVALHTQAYVLRPDGYSFFLRALLPFHSFALVAGLQHLMGLAIAVMLYALLRRWGVPKLLATIASLPLLLDVHQIQLEQTLLSDTLFMFLMAGGITLLAWNRRVSPVMAGVAGLALALSVLTRTAGVPILILAGLYLLVRWSGWRALIAFVLVAVVPLGSYVAWYHHERGSYAFSTADGIFLYARVMKFADCTKIKPPADLAVLCNPGNKPLHPVSSDYVWHGSQLTKLPGPKVGAVATAAELFVPSRNDPALKFAIKAIEAQPLSYLRVGLSDFMRSFTWGRTNFPNAETVAAYRFSRHPKVIDPTRIYVGSTPAGQDMTTYEQGNAQTRVVQPFADAMIVYQEVFALPGPILAIILLIGFAALVAFRRRDERRWQVLLLWLTAMGLLLVAPFSIQFDYRYVMPAVPLASAAAALALVVLVPRWSGQARAVTPAEAQPAPAADEAASTLDG